MTDYGIHPLAGYQAADLPALSFGQGGPRPTAENAVEQFQGILLGEMMKAMRATVPESGLLEGGSAKETFQSLLDQEYVQAITRQMGGLGLGDALKQQLGLAGPAEIKKSQKT